MFHPGIVRVSEFRLRIVCPSALYTFCGVLFVLSCTGRCVVSNKSAVYGVWTVHFFSYGRNEKQHNGQYDRTKRTPRSTRTDDPQTEFTNPHNPRMEHSISPADGYTKTLPNENHEIMFLTSLSWLRIDFKALTIDSWEGVLIWRIIPLGSILPPPDAR